MIWHFAEVWVLMLAAFAIGCPLGAIAYDLIARSELRHAQGAVADLIGNFVDGIKSRLGIGPVWRPEYRRLLERPVLGYSSEPGTDEASGGQLTATLDADWKADAASEPDLEIDERHGEDLADLATDDGDWAEDDGPIDGDMVIEGAALPTGVFADDGIVPMRPASLAAPRNGVPDDLQRVRGIGERNERRLNQLGIFHFGQIAAWTPAEMRWVALQLAFPERVEREDWVGQAIILASGGDTGFVKSADRRRARRQRQLEEETLRIEHQGAEAEPLAEETDESDRLDADGEDDGSEPAPDDPDRD